jgi:hypothetical protein
LEYGFNLSRYLGFELPQEGRNVKRLDYRPLDLDSYDITLIGFTDYGHASIKEPVPGEKANQDLWSTGIGLEVEGGRNLVARTYLGVALTDTESGVGTKLTRAGDVRWDVSILFRY